MAEVVDLPAGREPGPGPADQPPQPAPLVADASPEESEALAETLDAQTPLLRRAFSNVWLPDNDSVAIAPGVARVRRAAGGRAHVRGDERDHERDPGEHEQPGAQAEERPTTCPRAAGPRPFRDSRTR